MSDVTKQLLRAELEHLYQRREFLEEVVEYLLADEAAPPLGRAELDDVNRRIENLEADL